MTQDNLPVIPVTKGGLGTTSMPEGYYVVGNGTNQASFKTPYGVRVDIGLGTTAAAVATLGLYPVGRRLIRLQQVKSQVIRTT